MVGAEERRKLLSRLGDEKFMPLVAVLKCLAAMVVLVVIAAGPWAFLARNDPSGATVQSPSGMDQAMAESKRVFDERRHTFESSGQLQPALEARAANSSPGQ